MNRNLMDLRWTCTLYRPEHKVDSITTRLIPDPYDMFVTSTPNYLKATIFLGNVPTRECIGYKHSCKTDINTVDYSIDGVNVDRFLMQKKSPNSSNDLGKTRTYSMRVALI